MIHWLRNSNNYTGLNFLLPLLLLRHAGVVELSVCSIFSGLADISGDYAVYLNHDLSMLRLVETFSESSPQLVLMLTIILQRGELDPVTGTRQSYVV